MTERRIDLSFNADPAVRALGLMDEYLFLKLILLPGHFSGVHQIGPLGLSEKIRLSPDEIEAGLARLEVAGLVMYDADERVVWVCSQLKYQGSASPKCWASVVDHLGNMPSRRIRAAFMEHYRAWAKRHPKITAEAGPDTLSDTLSDRVSHTPSHTPSGGLETPSSDGAASAVAQTPENTPCERTGEMHQVSDFIPRRDTLSDTLSDTPPDTLSDRVSAQLTTNNSSTLNSSTLKMKTINSHQDTRERAKTGSAGADGFVSRQGEDEEQEQDPVDRARGVVKLYNAEVWRKTEREANTAPAGTPKNFVRALAEADADAGRALTDAELGELFECVSRVDWAMGRKVMSNGQPFRVTLKYVLNPQNWHKFGWRP